eukprot:12929156-Prorocentrum_lima.AAC.1
MTSMLERRCAHIFSAGVPRSLFNCRCWHGATFGWLRAACRLAFLWLGGATSRGWLRAACGWR